MRINPHMCGFSRIPGRSRTWRKSTGLPCPKEGPGARAEYGSCKPLLRLFTLRYGAAEMGFSTASAAFRRLARGRECNDGKDSPAIPDAIWPTSARISGGRRDGDIAPYHSETLYGLD